MRTITTVILTAVIGLPSLSAETLEFDGAGNLIRNGQRSMVYNSQNKTVAVRGDAGTGDYIYKDSGSRLRKRFSLTSNPGQTTELLNPTRLMTQQAKHGARRGLVNHIYVNGMRLAALGPDAAGNPAIRYYHTDQVSSVKLVTDGKADVVQRHEYLPYGGEFPLPSAAVFTVPAVVNHSSPKFNSQEHDKESGLDFFNARHYDSSLAHFTSADTVIDGEDKFAGWNRYAYVQDNPIKYSDPTGNISFQDAAWGAGMLAVSLAAAGYFGPSAVLSTAGNAVLTMLEIQATTIVAYTIGYASSALPVAMRHDWATASTFPRGPEAAVVAGLTAFVLTGSQILLGHENSTVALTSVASGIVAGAGMGLTWHAPTPVPVPVPEDHAD